MRPGLLPWLLGILEALSSHRLLDRLIRGRLWIGIIAFALLGIVTLQLGLLKMNSGIGRSLERSATLQRENAALSIENSELTSGERVESQATGRLGMRLGTISGLHALSSHPRSDVSRAASALSQAQSGAAASGTATSSAATGAEATGGPAARSGGPSEAGETHATSEAGGTGEASSSHSEAGGEAAAGSGTETGGATAAPGG